MWGCRSFFGDAYIGDNLPNSTTGEWSDEAYPSTISTKSGEFQGFRCDNDQSQPELTIIFFSIYVVLTSWVIMSLFIGVISIGMFTAFEDMKEERKQETYQRRLAENSGGATMQELASASKSSKDRGSFHMKNPDELCGAERLAHLLDLALENEVDDTVGLTQNEKDYLKIAKKCAKTEEAAWFTSLITFVIVVVGVMIGVDTDRAMACERYFNREGNSDTEHCSVSPQSLAVAIIAQMIFTGEAIVKIVARGLKPLRYFDDNWNKLDFFIVVVGFVEMSPLSFIFEQFPIVVLRMLRLLRVFRLAKTLPRLRAIVEALMQGFGAVGWICALMVVVDYIIGAMCMILFSKNDPFHFGSIGRSCFTVMRLSTGDGWDQVLLVNLYGCEQYPLGYPILLEETNPQSQCTHSIGLGWASAFIFTIIVIISVRCSLSFATNT